MSFIAIYNNSFSVRLLWYTCMDQISCTMSRYFLSLAFISWLTPLVGQSGFPFPTDQAEWHVTKVTPILGPNDAFDQWMYWVNGDTLIVDSIAYSAVYARGTCHSDQTTSFQYQPYSPA